MNRNHYIRFYRCKNCGGLVTDLDDHECISEYDREPEYPWEREFNEHPNVD